MLMARTSHMNEFQGGSLPAEKPQLPSFSHFLSGVQDAESSGLRPSLSLPYNDTHHTTRHDLVSSINPFAQPKRRSTVSSVSASLPDDHFHGLARTMVPTGVHSPPQPESQPPTQFSSTQPHQAHDENVSSQETSVYGSDYHDGSRTKTVVREDYISGKGLYYVYDDGSVCPKAINGHIVNPKWGTTKAGKPRKRLGQACNTCREKKIRCDPQVPKCTQCQKFGRECKFESGKSSQKVRLSSPMTPEPQKDSLGDRHGSSASTETASEQNTSRQTSRSSVNAEHLSPASTAMSDEGPPLKRRRVSATPMDKSPGWQAQLKLYQSSPSDMNDIKSAREFSASVDPFDVDERLTLRYIRQYMDNVNNGWFHIFPSSVFSSRTSVDQSRRSSALGVLYAMMAFSATYSTKNHSRPDERGRTFAQIAEACLGGERAQPSCYDAVGNLILSFEAQSNGEISKSKYLNAKSVQICYSLGMNTEEGLDRLVSEFVPWFNLPPTSAKECMRRLFWLSFVGSCFHKYAKPEGVDNSRLECALRLPCDDTSYESGVVPALPVFRCNDSETQAWHPRSGHGPIAYLVEIALVLDEAIQNQNLATSHRFQEFESFLQKAKSRLLVLDRALRINFSDSQQEGTVTHSGEMRHQSDNLSSSGTSGIHLFYHLVAMVLNRHVAWLSLSAECVDRCVKETYNHAVQTMDLLNRLDEDGGTTMHFARMSRGSPITALAVLGAVDVITAAGPISEIFEYQDEGGEHGLKKMVTCALEILEEHSRHWREAETQSSLVQERLKLLLSLRHGQSNSQKAFYFRTPLHSPYGMDLDIVYGLPHSDYFKALGWGDRVQGKGDMMEMGVQLLDFLASSSTLLSAANMSSTTLTTTSPLPSRPLAPLSASGAATPVGTPTVRPPLPKMTPIGKPSPGTFRNPYLAEVVRRQSKAAISASNVNAAAINAGVIFFITVFYNTLQHGLSLALSLMPLSPDSAASIASYALYGLILLFLANILLSLRSLLPYSKPASYDDIPLTPSQRQLLGLPPSNAPTPQSNSGGSANRSPFITPPRYSRRLSSSSASYSPCSQLTGASADSTDRFSILGNYSPSPLSTSRYTVGFSSPANGSASTRRRTASGSPFSPGMSSSNVNGSPLFHKAVQHSHDRSSETSFDISSRSSFGVTGSSLGRSSSLKERSPSRRRNGETADREQISPLQKGVNYKWLYDKGF
ncbi:hypothetical protein DV736_g31, partial [Chaetothyriales sp. CBS 134916]